MAKTSQLFAKIDNTVMTALPSMLSEYCETRSYIETVLTLTTFSNAVATQLRYNTPNILSKLRRLNVFSEITRIDIKVIAKPKERLPPQRKGNRVPLKNYHMLNDTADTISSDELATSLRSLASTLQNFDKNKA
ncbi:hypothetical protein A9Q99_03635 [Gammaproteobacteria bacterium 45_16_T64]|nr:hypothetical protein A9Q99_03635 [Gammaproteobacteria bacterium 45_16_T64]